MFRTHGAPDPSPRKVLRGITGSSSFSDISLPDLVAPDVTRAARRIRLLPAASPEQPQTLPLKRVVVVADAVKPAPEMGGTANAVTQGLTVSEHAALREQGGDQSGRRF